MLGRPTEQQQSKDGTPSTLAPANNQVKESGSGLVAGLAWKDVVAPRNSGAPPAATVRKGGSKSGKGKRQGVNGNSSQLDASPTNKADAPETMDKTLSPASNTTAHPKPTAGSFDPSRSSALAPNRTHSAPPVEDHNLMQHKKAWQTNQPPNIRQHRIPISNVPSPQHQQDYNQQNSSPLPQQTMNANQQQASPMVSQSQPQQPHQQQQQQYQGGRGSNYRNNQTNGGQFDRNSNRLQPQQAPPPMGMHGGGNGGVPPMISPQQQQHMGSGPPPIHLNPQMMAQQQQQQHMMRQQAMMQPSQQQMIFQPQFIPPQQRMYIQSQQPQAYPMMYAANPGMYNNGAGYMPVMGHQQRMAMGGMMGNGVIMQPNQIQHQHPMMNMPPMQMPQGGLVLPQRIRRALDIINPETGAKLNVPKKAVEPVQPLPPPPQVPHFIQLQMMQLQEQQSQMEVIPSPSSKTRQVPTGIADEMYKKFTAAIHSDKDVNSVASSPMESTTVTSVKSTKTIVDEVNVGFSFGSFGGPTEVPVNEIQEHAAIQPEVPPVLTEASITDHNLHGDLEIEYEKEAKLESGNVAVVPEEVYISDFPVSKVEADKKEIFEQTVVDTLKTSVIVADSNIPSSGVASEPEGLPFKSSLTIDLPIESSDTPLGSENVSSEIGSSLKRPPYIKISEDMELSTSSRGREDVKSEAPISRSRSPIKQSPMGMTERRARSKSPQVSRSPREVIVPAIVDDPEDSWETSKPIKVPSPSNQPISVTSPITLRPKVGLRPGGSIRPGSGLSSAVAGSPIRPPTTKPKLAPVAPTLPHSSETIGTLDGGRWSYTKEDLRRFSGVNERPDGLKLFDIQEEVMRGKENIRSSIGGSFRAGGGFDRAGSVNVMSDRHVERASSVRASATFGTDTQIGAPSPWIRGAKLPPAPSPQAGGTAGGRVGQIGGRVETDLFKITIEPLQQSANRWKPIKDISPLAKMEKAVQSILNKMTREKFDRLSQQLLDIPMESLDMLSALVQHIFDKAVEEHFFADMYADLCVRLHEQSSGWTFVKVVHNLDANNWLYTPNVGVDTEVVGPFESQEEAISMILDESSCIEPVIRPCEMEIVELLIKDKRFIKILRSEPPEKEEEPEEGQIVDSKNIYCVFMSEEEGRAQYSISEEAFSTSMEAIKEGTRKSALRFQVLTRCQIEFENFERVDIYDVVNEEERLYKLSPIIDQDEYDAKLQEFSERRTKIKRRMLGNMIFVGELFKKEMLKEHVIVKCVASLLNSEEEKTQAGVNVKFKDGKVDEENLEALIKLLNTSGKALDAGKSKPKMDEYYKLIVRLTRDTKRVSSRLRFMLTDLLERRNNNWEPRRKEEKAVTMSEIRQTVAEEEAAKVAASRGQFPRDKSGRGGQDYGSRTGSVRDLRGDQRNAPMPKTDSKRGGTWQGQGQQQTSQRPAPSPSTLRVQQPGNARSMGPSSREIYREPPVVQKEATFSPSEPDPKLERKLDNIIKEYIINADSNELLQCIDELPPGGIAMFIYHVSVKCMECKESDRIPIYNLLRAATSAGNRMKPEDVDSGLKSVMELLDDIKIDCPKAPTYLGSLIGILIHSKFVRLPPIVQICKSNCEPSTVHAVFAAALRALLAEAKTLRDAIDIGNEQGMTLLLPELHADRAEGMSFLVKEDIVSLFPGLYACEVLKTIMESDKTPVNQRPSGWLKSALAQAKVSPELQHNRYFLELFVKGLLESDKLNSSGLPSESLLDELYSVIHSTSEGVLEAEEGVLWGCYHFVAYLPPEFCTGQHVVEISEKLQNSGTVTPDGLRRWAFALLKHQGNESLPISRFDASTRAKYAKEVFENAESQFTRLLGSNWMQSGDPSSKQG